MVGDLPYPEGNGGNLKLVSIVADAAYREPAL